MFLFTATIQKKISAGMESRRNTNSSMFSIPGLSPDSKF